MMARESSKGKNSQFRFMLVAAFVLVSILLTINSVHAGGNGTTLSATKTATAHYTRTFHWTIDKSVTPDTWNLFKGDTGTSQYTIQVTKDSGSDAAWVDGQICVTNRGTVATENLAITDSLSMPPSHTVIASVTVDVSGHPILASGETDCYSYSVDIPSSSITAGANYKDTVSVTITNHSGYLGTPFGPGPSATSILPNSPTLIYDSINVDDTNGGTFSFSASGSQTYSKAFSCNADNGVQTNTATIRETGDSDSASVTVNCYDPSVTKTAATSFTRTYQWTIDKTGDQASLTLAEGQSFVVNYQVKVDATYTDSNWAVGGTINVYNSAPISGTINGVSDAISGIGGVTVNCGVTFPYTLAAGGTLICTYSSSLPDASTRTNTATATQQNYAYDYQLNPTPSGTTDFTGTASVDFSSSPTITQIDQCIDISDTLGGSLGSACYGTDTLPKTFTYYSTVGPYGTCGDRTVDNKALFKARDSGTTGSDEWSVAVHIPCGGCTLSLGYWKTHAGFGPQPNVVSPLLPVWLGTSGGTKSIQVSTPAKAVSLLGFYGSNNVFEASNGVNKLYAQLLTAKLNINKGADGSSVASTITSADAFLATHNSLDWKNLTKSQQQQVLGWVTTLDNYNNGLIGPGHCSQ
jgi:hypothetical protein